MTTPLSRHLEMIADEIADPHKRESVQEAARLLAGAVAQCSACNDDPIECAKVPMQHCKAWEPLSEGPAEQLTDSGNFTFAQSAEAAECIFACMDENIAKFDAFGDGAPPGAVELHEQAKKLRDMLAPHRDKTSRRSPAVSDERTYTEAQVPVAWLRDWIDNEGSEATEFCDKAERGAYPVYRCPPIEQQPIGYVSVITLKALRERAEGHGFVVASAGYDTVVPVYSAPVRRSQPETVDREALAAFMHGMFAKYPGNQDVPDWQDTPEPRKGVWRRYADMALKEASPTVPSTDSEATK